MKRIVLIAVAGLMAFAGADTLIAAESVPAGTVMDRRQAEKKVEEVIFKVAMHCHKCVTKINENISFEKGLKSIDVSFEKHQVKLVYDPSRTSEARLRAAIQKLGYEVPAKLVGGKEVLYTEQHITE